MFNLYIINTRLPAGPARFKSRRVTTKKCARKCRRDFKYLSPRVDFLGTTQSATCPNPPMNTSTENQASIIQIVQFAIFSSMTNDLLGLAIRHNSIMSGHENNTVNFLGELTNG